MSKNLVFDRFRIVQKVSESEVVKVYQAEDTHEQN